MKKKGSIMIETCAAAVIASVCMLVSAKIYIAACSSAKDKLLNENIKMAVYNITNEIKYNMSYEDVKELADDNNEIKLKYTDNFNKDIIEKNLKDMQKGSDIIIKCSDDFMEYEIDAKGKKKFNFKQKFIKSWWMNEI